MNYKKVRRLLCVCIIVLSFVIITGSFSYAYYKSNVDKDKNTNVMVQTSSVSGLLLENSDPIQLSITSDNFQVGDNNPTGTTSVTAKLVANSKTNTASDTYNVSFDITLNDFEYTTPEQTPELILQITDANKDEVTDIPGLIYNEELKGFDITMAVGSFIVANNKEISVSNAKDNPKIETWNFKVIFNNLETDQSLNAGKSLLAEAKIQKESFSNVECPEGTTYLKEAGLCTSISLADRFLTPSEFVQNIKDSFDECGIAQDGGSTKDDVFNLVQSDYKIGAYLTWLYSDGSTNIDITNDMDYGNFVINTCPLTGIQNDNIIHTFSEVTDKIKLITNKTDLSEYNTDDKIMAFLKDIYATANDDIFVTSSVRIYLPN